MADELTGPESLVERAEQRTAAKRDGATVLRLRWGRLDLDTFTAAFEQTVHLCEPDARRLCFLSPGILADNADPAAASALAAALQERGEPCLVVPSAELLPLPSVTPVTHLRLTSAGVHPVAVGEEGELCPWASAAALSLAHVHGETTRVVPESTGMILEHALTATVYGGLWGLAHVPSDLPVSVETLGAQLDLIFTAPARRLRIDAHKFDFLLLGDQLQTTGEANIHDLARWFLTAAPALRTNVDAQELLATGRAALPQLSPPLFDDLGHWLLNLAHFSPPTAAGG